MSAVDDEIECLQELDRWMVERRGMGFTVSRFFTARISNTPDSAVTEDEGFVEDEYVRPYGLRVSNSGQVRFKLSCGTADPDGKDRRYFELSAMELSAYIPLISSPMSEIARDNLSEASLISTCNGIENRFISKSVLRDQNNYELNKGRAIIGEVRSDEAIAAVEDHYKAIDDYGMF